VDTDVTGPGPLSGVKIVDLTTMLSGPWATMQLGDQGAEVVKVEQPGKGDHVRSLGNQSGGMSSMFLNINRSKRSVTIDLKREKGVELLKQLASEADVFVQNFRPGVVDRLGVGEADIRALNPEIIYVSISGFGHRGPYISKPVYDPIIQAMSGLASVQGGGDNLRPRLIKTVLPDKLAAATTAQSITAALYAKLKTGKGQHLRLNMLDAMLSFLWASDMGGQTYVDRPVPNHAAASFVDLIYETKDDHMTVAVMNNKEWVALTKALDKPEWLEDERFSTPSARDAHVNERLEMTQEVLKTNTSDYWMERLEKEGVPCAKVLTRTDVIADPQVLANEILLEFEHPVAGKLRQTRVPGEFEGTPTEITRGAPRLGEHNRDVFLELGMSEAEIAALVAEGVIGQETYENGDDKCMSSVA